MMENVPNIIVDSYDDDVMDSSVVQSASTSLLVPGQELRTRTNTLLSVLSSSLGFEGNTRQRSMSTASYRMPVDEQEASIKYGIHPRTQTQLDVRTGFGTKEITFKGSVALNLNNCMGAAMVLMPGLCQEAGLATFFLFMMITYFLSAMAACMLCEAIQRIPGNDQFGIRYEFTTAAKHYYGHKWYMLTQVLYNISLQGANISAMIVASQVLDTFLYQVAGHSWALNYSKWEFVASSGAVTNLWDCQVSIISVGFLICAAICIPFGYLNLDENMWFQWFSFIGFWIFTIGFIVQFCLNSIPGTDFYVAGNATSVPPIPANGPDLTPAYRALGQPQVLGICIFAYSYVVTIPSWVNEKRPEVSVKKAIWIPATTAVIMNLLVGILGAWSFPLYIPPYQGPGPNGTTITHSGFEMPGADNILTFLAQPSQPVYTRYSTYLWNVTTLIPGIPVLAIMVRYNLLSGKVCGKKMAFFFGVVLPWIITMFCYESNILSELANWIAIVFQGFVNFVIPVILYRKALILYPRPDDHPRLQIPEDDMQKPLIQNQYNEEPKLLAVPNEVDGGESVLIVPLQEPVDAVPVFIRRYIRPIYIANFAIVFFTVLCLAAIVFNIIAAATSTDAGKCIPTPVPPPPSMPFVPLTNGTWYNCSYFGNCTNNTVSVLLHELYPL